jgi:hypothetical protein
VKPLFRICRTRRTHAGIATEVVEHEGCGVSIHADTADQAVARAKQLMPWLPRDLVAIQEAS